MNTTRSRWVSVLSLLLSMVVLPLDVRGCTRAGPFSFSELFDHADVILRATAVNYAKPPAKPDMMTTGIPDSLIRFRVDEVLRGNDLPETIALYGYLSESDDYNEMAVPYTFVRGNGRSGSCFANTYKQGASFLLFLKKTAVGYSSNISALGPSNEQLRSDRDPWLVWVKDQLKKTEKPKQKAARDWSRTVLAFANLLVWRFPGGLRSL